MRHDATSMDESRSRVELRALLMEHWDPIGVKGHPDAWDEYDSYLDDLLRRLSEGADVDAVASYLAAVETGQMELPALPTERRDIGERVVAWYGQAT